MDYNQNSSISRYDQISAARNINANSHPDARIAYTALNKVFQVRRNKQQSAKVQVNRQHGFTHPPFGINISPKPTV